MLKRIVNYVTENWVHQQIAISLAKGSVMMQTCNIVLTNAMARGLSGLVQDEENGIVEVRRSRSTANRNDFPLGKRLPQLHYGVSIISWRQLFESQGYRFVTFNQNGIKQFLSAPSALTPQFQESVPRTGFCRDSIPTSQIRHATVRPDHRPGFRSELIP